MLSRTAVERIIGKGFADNLDSIVFECGSMVYSKRDMVDELGCGNFVAAARLAKVLRKLGVNTPSQLNRLDPFSLARCKGIGETALFVAMCILEKGEYDVIKWWEYKDNNVKFSSFKSHAMRRARKHKVTV